MDQLNDKIYFPAVRASKFELLALLEIEATRKPKLSPMISVRGNEKQIISFASKWDGSAFWLDSSRFAQDTSDALSSHLNDPSGNFSNKLEFLDRVTATNAQCRPIIGFRSGDPARAVTQFALRLLERYPIIAIRIEGTGKALDRNLNTARAILNAVSDEDFSKILLIVDLSSQTEMPSLQEEGPVMKSFELLNEYPLKHVLTLSTSWPDDRPDRGSSCYAPCVDPFWQALAHQQLAARNIRCFYGDYAATNPVKDIGDDFDPSVMSAPIPFAGYFVPFAWYQERQGKSGENEKFRDIASTIRQLPGYHSDSFCWGTKEIAAIATGMRDKAGSVGYWNKIRINQHICAMLKELESGILQQIVNSKSPDDEDDELI